jgi:hypothetical protein
VNQVGDNLSRYLPDLKLGLQAHVHMSVVKQIKESEPLPVQFLNRCCIPPVLVEFSVGVVRQLGQCVGKRLEKQENQQHDLENHRHLKLQVELQKWCRHVSADNRDYVLCYHQILHELLKIKKKLLTMFMAKLKTWSRKYRGRNELLFGKLIS